MGHQSLNTHSKLIPSISRNVTYDDTPLATINEHTHLKPHNQNKQIPPFQQPGVWSQPVFPPSATAAAIIYTKSDHPQPPLFRHFQPSTFPPLPKIWIQKVSTIHWLCITGVPLFLILARKFPSFVFIPFLSFFTLMSCSKHLILDVCSLPFPHLFGRN